jgi:hypothetical protein
MVVLVEEQRSVEDYDTDMGDDDDIGTPLVEAVINLDAGTTDGAHLKGDETPSEEATRAREPVEMT